ncbi:MAG: hypothetical protein ACOX8K_11460 [Lachnospiraceae bacterium]|jgi:hypothetical protein
MKTCLKTIKYVAGAVCLYVLLLMLVFLIPDKGIESHRTEAMNYIDEEGEYPKPFFDSASARLDNVTDRIMIGKTVPESDNLLIAAMNPGYARYWHGYLVFLRPLLLFFDYFEIRFLGYCISTMLVFVVFGLLMKQEGWGVSIAFAVSMVLTRFIVVPVSLQFSSCFNIMLLFCIWLLRRKDKIQSGECQLAVPFAIIGSVVNFMDFLTAPVTALGVPLAICTLIRMKNEKNSWKNNTAEVIKNSCFWVFGYGFTWFSKWFFATIFLKKNIFAEALSAILLRTDRNTEYSSGRILAIGKNIFFLMGTDGIKILFPIFSILLIWFVILIWKFRKRAAELLPFILIACMPYVWYFALANHSYIHGFFTYRSQIATVFSGGIMLELLWKWKNKIVEYKEM